MEDDSGQGFTGRIISWILKRPPLTKEADLALELNDLMNEGQAKGLISGEESDMVHGVLDLKETTAHSIMIPRTEMSSASIDTTLGEVIKLVSDCGHTRIPIFRNSIDEIAGILHAKDLLRLWGADPDSTIPPNILRKPYFVPRNQNVSELLKDMRSRKTHLAVVTDEYGGTEGIITIEDILEEIVGEIMDEHDDERPLLTPIDESSLLVDARLESEKLEEYFGITLPEGDFESVGGFIISLTGRVPKIGEKITYEDFEILIKSADARKIGKALIKRVSPPAPADVLE